MTTLRFALVGCGRIAVKHSDLLGNNKIKNSQLAAVCDIDEDKAKKLAVKYNVPYYTDMDTMMQNESVDVVSILTESGNHAKHVINLAKYAKHIIVEKPMALNLDDADNMIKACSENNHTLS